MDVNFSVLGDDGRTPLYFAAEHDDADVARVLIAAGANLDMARTTTGYTPVLIAVWRGHGEIVEILASAGADLDKADHKGQFPLEIVCETGCCEDDVMWALVRGGADVNKTYMGLTPLLSASREGSITFVEAFIAAGADVNRCSEPQDEEDGEGYSSLWIAAFHGQLDVVQALVRAGASTDVAFKHLDEDGGPFTSCGIAAKKGHRRVVAFLEQYQSPRSIWSVRYWKNGGTGGRKSGRAKSASGLKN
jgi:ankyrin repeat protein